MSINSFGHLLRLTTWGESHGPAIGCVVDGCPPGLELDEAWVQQWLDRRRPGTSKNVSPRQEPDQVRILSGVHEGRTTGTPILIRVAFKPTSSIGSKGRHDPCVGIRGAPVVEAMVALVLADHKLLHRGQCG